MLPSRQSTRAALRSGAYGQPPAHEERSDAGRRSLRAGVAMTLPPSCQIIAQGAGRSLEHAAHPLPRAQVVLSRPAPTIHGEATSGRTHAGCRATSRANCRATTGALDALLTHTRRAQRVIEPAPLRQALPDPRPAARQLTAQGLSAGHACTRPGRLCAAALANLRCRFPFPSLSFRRSQRSRHHGPADDDRVERRR